MRQENMRGKLSYAIIVIFMSIMILGLPVIASASYYFNGAKKVVSNNGAAITAETQSPSIASGSYVSCWSMTTDGTNYAQVGWWKKSAWSGPKYFYEYRCGSTFNQVTLGDAVVGSNNNFKVGCDATTMYFIINGYSYGSVPLTSIPFSRDQVQFFGETHNTSDQCPGSVSNPVTMGSAQYKNTSNSWVTATSYNPYSNGQGSLTTMVNNISSSGSNLWEIWDLRY